ncbi:MAG: hypothetical protein ACYC4B_32995 [Pirellulaceae bacterium]
MSTIAVVLDTPQYVLMHENCRIGPEVVASYAGANCTPIYGFSGAVAYEKFRLRSEQALTPYPLVKVYLRMQASQAGDELRLVVVDAAGPDEAILQAATVEDVLEAHENGTTHVTAGYVLTFDEDLCAYRVQEACV